VHVRDNIIMAHPAMHDLSGCDRRGDHGPREYVTAMAAALGPDQWMADTPSAGEKGQA